MVHLVLAIHAAVAVDAKLVGLKIAKARVSQIMFMKHGLAIRTAMMVHIFLPIMVAMNAQLVLPFG